jgi:hypothetical protein
MLKIQRIKMILVSALLPGIIFLVPSTAIANDSQDLIEKSISNPSGPQLNLNIHNKDPLPLSKEKVLPDRASILTAEYGESTRQYIIRKKSTVKNLTIFEPPAGCFSDASNDSSPQLMFSCVEEEFYVAGRIQAISHKEQTLSHVSSSLLFPILRQEAYTDTYPEHTHRLDYKECSNGLIPSSDLSSIRHLSTAAPEGFVKFESTTSREEKPSAITPLFKWLGWVCRMIFVGTDEDGDIDAYGLTFVTTD